MNYLPVIDNRNLHSLAGTFQLTMSDETRGYIYIYRDTQGGGGSEIAKLVYSYNKQGHLAEPLGWRWGERQREGHEREREREMYMYI